MTDHNQAIYYAVKNLVALLQAKKMPHAIVVQDPYTGIVTSHSYTPVDSSLSARNGVEITIHDERRAS